MTQIDPHEAEEYTRGLGQVFGGGWRLIATAQQLGVPQALGLSTQDWVRDRLGGYIHLAVSERREAVTELAAEGMSQRKIGDVLGVDQKTVSRDLAEANASNDHADSATEQPKPEAGEANALPDHPTPEEVMAEYGAGRPEARIEVLYAPKPLVQVNEGDEWYTPAWLFDALGVKYALDVCAPLDQTFSTVPADRVFTIEDDGLAQPWAGTVWCNPPYSKPEPWARRMIHHGDGLLLTHMPMNAGWCVDVWEACDAIRLFQAMEFVRPDGTSQRPGYWLQLTAFGPAATSALGRLQPLGMAAENKRRIASPMWKRAT